MPGNMPRSSQQTQPMEVNPSGQRVLLVGWPEVGMPYFTGIMGAGLRLRGADARVLQCDAAIKSCEVYPQLLTDIVPFITPLDFFPCDRCQRHSRRLPNELQIPTYYLSEFVREFEYMQALETVGDLCLSEILDFRHEGLLLGEHVRTSLHRTFQVGNLVDDQATLAAGQRMLATAIQLTSGFERLIAEFQPQVVVIYHGIYLVRGTCLEVFKKHGIRIVCWDPVYLWGGLEMSHGDTYHHEFRMEPWEAWEDLQLTPEQNERLDAFLEERRSGMRLQEAPPMLRKEPKESLLAGKKRSLADGRRKVVLFTNISWDGRVKVDSSLYDGPIEWVIDTMQHLAGRQDLQVIVRIHPYEVKKEAWKGLRRANEDIEEAFPVLPSNISLILPENKVSSYDLAALADVVIVYSTLMGLEALAMGKQVIITGDAYYSNKGFGIQPTSREEYLEVLSHLNEISPLDTQELERVRRYAYHFFFRRWMQLPIPHLEPNESWVKADLSELMPGKSNALDRACEGILQGTPFHVGAP